MTIKELTSKLCKAEGKKKSISIGNCREVIAILSDIAFLDPEGLIKVLVANGKKRKTKGKKK